MWQLALLKALKPIMFSASETIVNKNELGDDLFFLMRGEVHAVASLPKPFVIYPVTAVGSLVGEHAMRDRGEDAAALHRLAGRAIGVPPAGQSAHQLCAFMMRCWSRFQSRSLIVSRLSWVFLPLASASSTFARPVELK